MTKQYEVEIRDVNGKKSVAQYFTRNIAFEAAQDAFKLWKCYATDTVYIHVKELETDRIIYHTKL